MPTPRLQPATTLPVMPIPRPGSDRGEPGVLFATYLQEAKTEKPAPALPNSEGHADRQTSRKRAEVPDEAKSSPVASQSGGPSAAAVLGKGSGDDEPARHRVFAFSDLGIFGVHGDEGTACPGKMDDEFPTVELQKTQTHASSDRVAASNGMSTPVGQFQTGGPHSGAILHRDAVANMRSTDDTSPVAAQIVVPACPSDETPNIAEISGSMDQASAAASDDISRTADPLPTNLPPASPADIDTAAPRGARATAMPTVDGEQTVELGSSPAPKSQPATPEIPGANAVSVTLYETDGALMVAARLQGAEAFDPVQIRNLVELTAAEFGLQVAELQFNGAPTQAPSPSGRSSRGSSTR